MIFIVENNIACIRFHNLKLCAYELKILLIRKVKGFRDLLVSVGLRFFFHRLSIGSSEDLLSNSPAVYDKLTPLGYFFTNFAPVIMNKQSAATSNIRIAKQTPKVKSFTVYCTAAQERKGTWIFLHV